MEHTRIPWRIVTENPIIQQEGSVNRSERGVAWRGGGGHRFARFSAFPWHRLRSNPTRNENPTSRKNRRYPRGYHRYVEWIETTPSPFRRNALLVSQNSSFVRSPSTEKEREKGLDDPGNGFMTIKEKPVIYHERIFDGLPLGGFLKIERNPVKIEKDNGIRWNDGFGGTKYCGRFSSFLSFPIAYYA